MKHLKHITRTLIMLIAISATAQQGINYKALVKDSGGNVIANQNVDIQFIIYEGPGETTNVYQETHSLVLTDANGIIIINIGEGAVDSGIYDDIDWGADDHYLNVQIDTGSGLTDMGTTQFMAVPYALHAETATSASNVTGLEALDEGNGSGWSLIGRDPANYGNIGSNAVDLSYSIFSSSIYGATGNSSTAIGYSTTASGLYSIAMGWSTTASGVSSIAMGFSSEASGIYSTAIGYGPLASGEYSTAMGRNTTASGHYSTAMGFGTKAEAYSALAVGQYNIGGGDPAIWNTGDPLFEIGNGSSHVNRSNVLTVLKNGTITAPSLSNTLINTAGDKALITKEYADINYDDTGVAPSGLEALTEGSIGWRLIGQNPANYGNIGFKAVDLSASSAPSSTRGATGLRSVALGADTTASGNYSTAMGINTIAGNYSTAMGISTTASGTQSTAMGGSTTASGTESTAMGSSTTASGFYSTAMGLLTKAEANNVLAIGRYNIGGGNATTWVETNNLFEVGNGTSDGNRSNAFTILKNGTITAPSFTNTLINTAGNKALITKEYADINYNPTGIEALDEGNGLGWRLIGRNPANHGDIGYNAIDLSTSNFSSSTLGATGNQSIAIGYQATSSGDYSTAMGAQAKSSGSDSVAIGYFTKASGSFSTAMGFDTKAESRNVFAIGRYNIGGGNAASWVNTDKLFEVGNGSNNSSRNNAFTILKNGNVGVDIATPTVKLQVDGTNDASLSNGSGLFIIGAETTSNIVFDRNEIIARNNGVASNLHLQNSGGDVYVGGGLVHSSDRRLKQDIVNIDYGLNEVLKLRPVSYHWKISPNASQKSLGFVAQEVQPLINDLVSVNENRDQTLALDYNGLIPILVKAIQEQQEVLEKQQDIIDIQKSDIKSLMARMQKIENATGIN